jgi:hypothetical protein
MNDTLFDDLLVAAATWLLAGCAVWAALIGLAALVEASTAGRLPATTWVGCPPALRRALLAGLGVVLVTSQVPATAEQRGLPSPARPLGGRPVAQPRLVVRPGDALWRLAEDRLPPTATAAEVADLVLRLHRRNREVIGPDPDLIRPGERLVVPTPPTLRRPHQENP